MPSLPVRTFPDPILKQPTRHVPKPDQETRRFIERMVRTMRSHARCVGLAAPQVGSRLRIAVMDVTGHPKAGAGHGLLVLVNPSLRRLQGGRLGREGCLSVPDFTGNVRRAQRVELEAQDERGRRFALWLEGFEAVVAQHEVDHLDGRLFLDRVASLGADVFPRKTYR
ncbi:MAG TPA: peptide deformylase [bacterium]